jgi:hypothetical protein
MKRTKHQFHTHYEAWCPTCRWEAKSPDEQARYSQMQSVKTTLTWRRKHPDRAVVRDRLLADAVPGTCNRCLGTGVTRAIVDYKAEVITGWRCPACWNAAREAWRTKGKAA